MEGNKANTKAEKVWIIVLFVFIVGIPVCWGLYSYCWFDHHLIRPLDKEYRAKWVRDEKGEIKGWAEGRGFRAWRHFGKVFFINCAFCSIVLGSGAYFLSQFFKLKGCKERGFSKGQREGRQEYEEENERLKSLGNVQTGMQQAKEIEDFENKKKAWKVETEGLRDQNKKKDEYIASLVDKLKKKGEN